METFFILLHRHHQWHEQSNSNYLAYIIPFATLFIGFIINMIYQNHIKQVATQERLSNEIIDTCDKMIRYAKSAEENILEHRYFSDLLNLHKGDLEKKKFDEHYAEYYHVKAEEDYLKYDLLKSDLKRNLKDLKNHWDKEDAKKIMSIMSEVAIIPLRDFSSYFTETDISNEVILLNKKNLIHNNIINDIIFKGVGFYLIRIQKLIDKDSPTLYLTKEKEIELNIKIKDLDNKN